ncbi:CopD family protein [Pelagicoccus sp. SDUM812005]|uniref:CopD family protein n=1 Tax=Pelagicoccus sp. SDUM812005 TaxID=3041257 RepID=UPI00280E76AA|nr:CopD family protein [Pelagicoccus sp. SDUM812005]MDQ8181712.1 hypothetical protein [Pelagicoccus sp. SDUM812005]
MNAYGALIVLHLLGACVWAGWHFVLAGSLMPQLLKEGDGLLWDRIESVYRNLGLPAFAVQALTGFALAYAHTPDIGLWFDLENPMGRLIGLKVLLFAASFAVLLDAMLRLAPQVETRGPGRLKWHLWAITLLAVLQIFVGASFRIGWLY